VLCGGVRQFTGSSTSGRRHTLQSPVVLWNLVGKAKGHKVGYSHNGKNDSEEGESWRLCFEAPGVRLKHGQVSLEFPAPGE
jgi:hypothetical protein